MSSLRLLGNIFDLKILLVERSGTFRDYGPPAPGAPPGPPEHSVLGMHVAAGPTPRVHCCIQKTVNNAPWCIHHSPPYPKQPSQPAIKLTPLRWLDPKVHVYVQVQAHLYTLKKVLSQGEHLVAVS